MLGAERDNPLRKKLPTYVTANLDRVRGHAAALRTLASAYTMAGPACTDASDFFHPPIIPIADFFSLAGGRVVERGVGRRGAPRRACRGLHRLHPPDRIGDPERARPRAPKQRGVNASRPRDGQ
eukprot:5310273-Pleurochrysis_carterae.AAC.4